MLRFLIAISVLAGCEPPEAEAPDAGALPPGFVSPNAPSVGDEAGSAVAASGAEILVGAPGDDGPPDPEGNQPSGLERSGAVLVLDAATFEPISELRAPTPRRGARFGAAIAVAGDLLAVGAPGDFNPDPDAPIRDATGAVYIFVRQGTTWTPLGDPLVPDGLRAGDRFGYSVSLAGDRLIAGAPGDDRAGDSTGGLYVFIRSGDQFVPAP